MGVISKIADSLTQFKKLTTQRQLDSNSEHLHERKQKPIKTLDFLIG